MTIGDLEITLRREGPQLVLHVAGRPFGVETVVAPDDVRRLTEYLVNEAQRLKNEKEG